MDHTRINYTHEKPDSLFLISLQSFLIYAQSAIDKPQVSTENGIVEGVSNSGINIFRGIPFAEPPIGNLRWKAPQPAKNWEGVLKADHFGSNAMQLPVYGDMLFRSESMSEDCLYLNVWTPEGSEKELLPVLVYFYGGGYRAGDGSELRYDGESMARKGIVSVTVNYRLGVFGFMAHPELSEETEFKGSGNYALMDQTLALEWVKKNIQSFGGDPDRVTIAGESCGARSVCAQMASPLAKDLFSAAIGESGALMNSTIVPLSLLEAENLGMQFQSLANKNSLAELRAMPADELLKISGFPEAPYFAPNVDNFFLPDYPSKIFEEGNQADVPLLLGWNSEEMNFRFVLRQHEPTVENFNKVLSDMYQNHATEAMNLYQANSDAEVESVATDLAGDIFSGFNTWKWMELHAKSGNSQIYRYFYSRPRPAMRPELTNMEAGFAGGIKKASENSTPTRPTGAVHSAEIEYALGNLPTNRVYDWQPEDYKVSEIMQGYFVNFIKTHDPNGIGLPEWPTSNDNLDIQMRLDVQSEVEIDPNAKRYHWLNQLPANLTNTPVEEGSKKN